MFERFSDDAHSVVSAAQEEARRLQRADLEGEHLLLGVLRHHEGGAMDVLERHGLDLDRAREVVERIVEPGDVAAPQYVGFAASGRDALQGALRLSLELGHDEIGDEHILLALLERRSGIATRVLHEAGMDRDAIHRDLVRGLQQPVERRGAHDLAAGLSRALEWAGGLAHGEGRAVDPGDLLVGLVAAEPLCARALVRLDVEREALEEAVHRARREG